MDPRTDIHGERRRHRGAQGHASAAGTRSTRTGGRDENIAHAALGCQPASGSRHTLDEAHRVETRRRPQRSDGAAGEAGEAESAENEPLPVPRRIAATWDVRTRPAPPRACAFPPRRRATRPCRPSATIAAVARTARGFHRSAAFAPIGRAAKGNTRASVLGGSATPRHTRVPLCRRTRSCTPAQRPAPTFARRLVPFARSSAPSARARARAKERRAAAAGER